MRRETRGGLYAIVNAVTGAQYFGSTTTFAERRWRHLRELRGGTHHTAHLQAAWNKYGGDAFEFVILAVLEKSELRETEQRLLDLMYGKESCYNVSRDATAPMQGRKHRPESIAQMVAKNTGQKRSPEFCAKMAAINKGRKPHPNTLAAAAVSSKEWMRTPEYRKGVGERFTRHWASLTEDERRYRGESTRLAHTGKKVSKETRKRISEAKKGQGLGVPLPDETRSKMSAAQKGRTFSPVHREKIAATLTGRKLPAEHVAKLRAAAEKRRGSKMDPDAVARSAAARTGAKRSPEARARMSKAAKARVKRDHALLA